MNKLSQQQFSKSLSQPDSEYRKHYNRGWKSSQGANASLDRLDARNAPDAQYDGYLDHAAGREKFHSWHCRRGEIDCAEHNWGSR